ncbi:MAG: 1,4-beta-xylanase [Chryseolinea sp.]
MKFYRITLVLCLTLAGSIGYCQQGKQWTLEEANAWNQTQPWLVGANYIPATAINQLEMWQAETFDTARINVELQWAENIGMNIMRVFLHDLSYKQDPKGFVERLDTFLAIADRHHITILITFFDSCWDPFPKSGKQRIPKPHVHNSGWVQSPGQDALKDSKQYERLKVYVTDVVKRFRQDKRIWGWDVWNEPDNMTGAAYEKVEIKNKVELVTALLPRVFEWVKDQKPQQPVTSGIWIGDWSSDDKLRPIEKIQIEYSDVITFHNYDGEKEFEKRVLWLQRYGRPLICTEYMARGNNSTFHGIMPVAKKYKVGVVNWGFVSGKSQTIYPWDSWEKTYTAEPPLWFHDIFRTDGNPYRQYEVDFIKGITAK